LQLGKLLEKQFSFSEEEAEDATQSFLNTFRRYPDNNITSLELWRTQLWRDALPYHYKHLAEEIYPLWLQLRYRYLVIQPDYIQMLKSFREASFLLGLITNGPSNAQWEKIAKTKANKYFDCILVSGDLPWGKPNPNIFYRACDCLNVEPEDCAMIGDKLDTDIKVCEEYFKFSLYIY